MTALAAPQLLPALTFAEYAALDALNWSLLKELRASPLHLKHRRENPRPEADPLRLGRAGHSATFEPETFGELYAVWDEVTEAGDKTAPRRGRKWDAFQAWHAGKTILTVDQRDLALAIGAAVRENPIAAAYLRDGAPEQSLVWTDERTGVRCKCRVDWLTTIIGELKTTRTADPWLFGAIAARLGYHGQQAWYQRGVKAVLGVELPAVMFVVESAPPHDVIVYRLDEDALVAGHQEVDHLLGIYAECERTGKWPGRFSTEQALRLPQWAAPDEEDGLDALDAGLGAVAVEG